jgi:hypothetical protein
MMAVSGGSGDGENFSNADDGPIQQQMEKGCVEIIRQTKPQSH